MNEFVDFQALLDSRPQPEVGAVPTHTKGFRLRLDLLGTEPPVWRRLEVPGDLTLPRVHDAIQAALGWTNSHLHRFHTGSAHDAPYFVTQFDVDEGDEGVLEDDVRLDQLLAGVGDSLWYDYDFGDGWDHRLEVEAVLDQPPRPARCVGGQRACPPEDSGGPYGYADLARWVRSGYDDALLPTVFESADQAHSWLPPHWHPDTFDLVEADRALSRAVAEPVPVPVEVAELMDMLQRRGVVTLRQRLAAPAWHGPTDVSLDDAVRLTQAYRDLLDVVSDGVGLTGAGYLPPAVVEQVAVRTGLTEWWFGKANREDLTPPVRALRTSARALGLVSVRRGRLAPTAAGVRGREDPDALLSHIAGRLPLDSGDFDRHAGWIALVVAGSEDAIEDWYDAVGDLLFDVGWETAGAPYSRPIAHSLTLDVLRTLAGDLRVSRPTGLDPAVAALARGVIARG